jgi:hypothetical protein
VVSVDQNSASEELMLVTNVSGLTYTVTRGIGGTSAQSHNNGAPVVHVMYAQDLTDASAHIGAFDAVHGLSVGSLVVGTTDAQTLTNKALTSPTITTPSITSPTITGTTTAGTINSAALTSSAAVTAVDFPATGLTGAVTASRYAGATGGGSPVTGTFLAGDFVIDVGNGLIWVCHTGGSPGTWFSLANLTSTQTFNNKTLNAAVFTGAATGTGSIALGSFFQGLEFITAGLTGATASAAFVGGTTSGAPTTGTFAVGNFIVDQTTGTLWVCVSAGTPGTWSAAYTSAFKGPGQTTNVITGGANRSNTLPFTYSTQATIVVSAGSGWTFTSSGTTFVGCGEFHVTPADNSGSLGFLSVINANCNIASGNLTLAGAAFTAAAAGVATSASIKVNISAIGW